MRWSEEPVVFAFRRGRSVLVSCDFTLKQTTQTDRHSVIRCRLVTIDKEANATI